MNDFITSNGYLMFTNQTHQCTKALLAYIRSNFLSNPAHAARIAVEFDRQQTALVSLAESPPGTTVGGW